MMGEFDENYSGQDDYGCEEMGSAQIKSSNQQKSGAIFS